VAEDSVPQHGAASLVTNCRLYGGKKGCLPLPRSTGSSERFHSFSSDLYTVENEGSRSLRNVRHWL